MESPSKIDRRQAWALSSRHKFNMRETAESPADDPHPHLSLQDDVFVDGCSGGKIETWLQGCGNDASPAKNSHLGIGRLRTGASFEDDLSLGAEATALYTPSNGHQFRTPQQKLNLPLLNMGHSVASSAFSTTTCKTASSVSEILHMRAEDAEDILYQLGFGCEEPQVTARIPVRFFNFPSQLRGINFRLFLESQLTRIHQEDPCLSLASRFRQVEALTAMANAFYSLYSHVSRTPLQKLAPPQLTLSSPIPERIGSRNSVRSEPRSPVERLKDTISKMCLYTSSRGSEPASPSGLPRKRKSVSALETSVNVDANDQVSGLEMEVDDLEPDMDWFIEEGKELEESAEAAHSQLSLPEQRDGEVESKDSVSLKSTSVTMEPVPLITHDVIRPQIIEYVNQAPYRCLQTNSTDVKDSPFAQPSIRPSNTITSIDNQTGVPYENWTSDVSSQLNSQKSLCQITITGWEGDSTFPERDAQELCSSKYLSPLKPLNLSRLSQCPKQGNSFELEEVHSAEEEDVSSELNPRVTLFVSTQHHKPSPLRVDSFQSDSSGYAEEDVPHLSTPEKHPLKCDITEVTSRDHQSEYSLS